MDPEKRITLHTHVHRKSVTHAPAHAYASAPAPAPAPASDTARDEEKWRKGCGCIRTSDKLKEILKSFPSPPPPSPTYDSSCISAHCHHTHEPKFEKSNDPISKCSSVNIEASKVSSRSWQIIYELVQLVQLSVTATALALYYLIYCYMQLVYYTLRSALYFHHADGPMKITIGVVTVTSLIVGFNLLIRMEKMIGIF